LATNATISSGAFDRELGKLFLDVQVTSVAAPLLVPLVENDATKWAAPIIADYLRPLGGVDTLILGCTHYPLFKHLIADQMGHGVTIISQDEIIPAKVHQYLIRSSGPRLNYFQTTLTGILGNRSNRPSRAAGCTALW